VQATSACTPTAGLRQGSVDGARPFLAQTFVQVHSLSSSTIAGQKNDESAADRYRHAHTKQRTDESAQTSTAGFGGNPATDASTSANKNHNWRLCNAGAHLLVEALVRVVRRFWVAWLHHQHALLQRIFLGLLEDHPERQGGRVSSACCSRLLISIRCESCSRYEIPSCIISCSEIPYAHTRLLSRSQNDNTLTGISAGESRSKRGPRCLEVLARPRRVSEARAGERSLLR